MVGCGLLVTAFMVFELIRPIAAVGKILDEKSEDEEEFGFVLLLLLIGPTTVMLMIGCWLPATEFIAFELMRSIAAVGKILEEKSEDEDELGSLLPLLLIGTTTAPLMLGCRLLGSGLVKFELVEGPIAAPGKLLTGFLVVVETTVLIEAGLGICDR
jgi:hypothetical protein